MMGRTMKTRTVHSVAAMSKDIMSEPKTTREAMQRMLGDYAGRITFEKGIDCVLHAASVEVGIADSSGENGLWKMIF